MASGDPIRVFVTHAWSESADYQRVFEFLEGSRNFRYINCSAPGRRPPLGGVEAERDELRRQISTCEVVIALADLLPVDRQWLQFEMTFAQSAQKPVVLLPAFGNELRMPPDFKGLSNEHVDWDERAIVAALRRQARHEETNRWDTIDFTPP